MEELLNLNKDSKSKKNEADTQKKSQTKQAENIWSMLDEMAATNPDSYKKFIEKTINEGKEAMKPPEPHMCVKSKLLAPKKGTLFINFFSWQRISAAKSDEDPIPVYGSKLEYDKEIAVVNMVFNPEILEKYGKNSTVKGEQDALIGLAFQYCEQENPNVKLDTTTFDILKDTLLYGNLEHHISRLTKKNYKKNMSDLEIAKEALGEDTPIPDSILNKIGNLNMAGASSQATSSLKKETGKTLIEEVDSDNLPTYEEKVITGKDDTDQKINEIRINLPKVNSISECKLDMDAEFLTLVCKNKVYNKLKIPLMVLKEKYSFTPENIEAKFIKKTSILRVKIPLEKK